MALRLRFTAETCPTNAQKNYNTSERYFTAIFPDCAALQHGIPTPLHRKKCMWGQHEDTQMYQHRAIYSKINLNAATIETNTTHLDHRLGYILLYIFYNFNNS
jgi:hypothetical protein